MSLHAVSRACIPLHEFHEFACCSKNFHISLSEQLTRTSQCLFNTGINVNTHFMFTNETLHYVAMLKINSICERKLLVPKSISQSFCHRMMSAVKCTSLISYFCWTAWCSGIWWWCHRIFFWFQHKSSLEQVSHDKLNNVESESNIFCGDTELRKRI